jgi:hypothetical protein
MYVGPRRATFGRCGAARGWATRCCVAGESSETACGGVALLNNADCGGVMQHTAPIRKLPAGCAQPADPQGRSVTVACKEMLAPRPYRKSETSQVRYLPRLVRTPSIASCLPGVKPHPSRTRLVGLPWRWYLQTARRRGALTFFSPSACLMLSQCGALTSPSPYRCPSSPAVPPLHTCADLCRRRPCTDSRRQAPF